MKILVLFYSAYGHIFKMAEAVAAGAAEVEGAEVRLMQVPETLPGDILDKLGISEARKAFAHVPVCSLDDLTWAEAIIFGTPTRFGNMCAQMRAFLDSTGGLWAKGALIGKIGSVFVSTGTQHGGQESTILSFHTTLLHHGMIIVGLPYSFAGQLSMEEITGGSPYGATTIAAPGGDRVPIENELNAARFQGKHVAGIAKKFSCCH